MGAKKRYSKRILTNKSGIDDCQGTIDDIDGFVLALLAEGLNFETLDRFLSRVEINRCSKSTFYKHQSKLAPYIIEAAKESCARSRRIMNSDSCLSMDGSWSTRRHAQHCFVSLCDTTTKKVVDFTVVSRTSDFFLPLFDGSSQAMEMVGFEELVKTWTTNLSYPKVDKFVHDNDSKALIILKKYKWDLEDFLDPNHVMKNLMSAFDSINDNCGKQFGEIRESFEDYLKFLFSDDKMTKKERLARYDNMYNHFIGDHSKCVHGNTNPVTIWNAKEQFSTVLLAFLQKHRSSIEKIDPKYRTQINECINSIKAQKANKTYSYKLSFALRCCIAVLQSNDPENWYSLLRCRIGLRPLRNKFYDQLYKSITKSIKQKEKRSHPSYKQKKYKSRKSYLLRANAKSQMGHVNCDPPDYKQVFESSSYKNSHFNLFAYDYLPNLFCINYLEKDTLMSTYCEFFNQYNILFCMSIDQYYRKKEKHGIIMLISKDNEVDKIINEGGTFNKKKLNLSRVTHKSFNIFKKTILVTNIDSFFTIDAINNFFSPIGEPYITSETSDTIHEGKKHAIIIFLQEIENERLKQLHSEKLFNPLTFIQADPQSAFSFINTKLIDENTTKILPSPSHDYNIGIVTTQRTNEKEEEEKEFEEEECINEGIEYFEEEETTSESDSSDFVIIKGDYADDSISSEVLSQQFIYQDLQNIQNITCGLCNNTATLCFLNALVQAIANIDWLANYFIEHAEKNNVLQKFSALLIRMRAFQPNPLNHLEFVNSLRKPEYYTQQQDAAEFMHLLYEKTINCLFDEEDTSTFAGKQRDMFICDIHRWETPVIPFVSIELPIEGCYSLTELLEINFSPQTANNLKINEEIIEYGTKHTIIVQLPRILQIILNRFQYNIEENRTTKNNQRVVFPIILNTMTWTSFHTMYDLAAIVAHKGTLETGHYICYASHSERWFVYDDERINNIGNVIPETLFGESDQNNEMNAYILFYKMTE